MEENKNQYIDNNYYIKYMVDVTAFECDLDLEKFTQPILKYLTPYLKYIEDELEKIDATLKMRRLTFSFFLPLFFNESKDSLKNRKL